MSRSAAPICRCRRRRSCDTGWVAHGLPLHCLSSVEWLDAKGELLAVSDSMERERFIAQLHQLHQHRAPRIAAHWDWLLRPLVAHDLAEPGDLRYRQIEYDRMPKMA